MKQLKLRKGAEKRIKAGHLWVYSNEVDVSATPLKDFSAGEQCLLESASGQHLGLVIVNPANLICGRLVSRDKQAKLDKSLLTHRIKIASALREQRYDSACYRLVYGDSDGLPGLVIDRFLNHFVVQISNAGMERLKDEIVQVLEKLFKPESILFKNNGKMRLSEGLESYVTFAKGDCAVPQLEENGVKFRVPTTTGQKTGWFYDHREGRDALRHYVKGKRVLDLFSYIGGWGVQAAAFGAKEVVCVDSSSQALEYVAKNAQLNECADKVCYLEGNVFDVCKTLKAEGQRFDVVIADPPAFIPRRKDKKAGEAAYQRLNQLAMRLLSKDGLLVSASCSMHLAEETLVDILRKTARTLEKDTQIIERFTQGADHPVLSAIPETRYLKALFVRVLPQG